MARAIGPSSDTLFDALIEAAQRVGADKLVLEDPDRKPLSYKGFTRAAFALGRKLAALTEPGERVGVMLPTSAGALVTFFALHAIGRTPTLLNFTAGSANLKAACKVARVRRVLTARRFIAQARLDDLVEELSSVCAITWLEDVRASVGVADKLYAAVAGAFPARFRARAEPADPGVVLFTSGSFGAPRGVLLTQANLIANVRQVAQHIALDQDWVFFNPLPTFHCFGLTAGALLPLLTGSRAFQYPSPLHVKQVPSLIKETGASVLLATDTFVNQYGRSAGAGELSGLEFVVCGAEKVREETHRLIADRFGSAPLVEGYGATECSPVIAVNTPQDNRHGTVGQLLPGVEARLEPVDGIVRGGRLFVRGPNVMAGYLNADGELVAPPRGWHDTGDVVEIDAGGFVRILGRVARFAKIGGEMVSLTAAEDLATSLWPDGRHAVVAIPDPRKGERLVLVTSRMDADGSKLVAHAQALGAPELLAPRRVLTIFDLPVLGSGKTDYVAVARLVEAEARKA